MTRPLIVGLTVVAFGTTVRERVATQGMAPWLPSHGAVYMVKLHWPPPSSGAYGVMSVTQCPSRRQIRSETTNITQNIDDAYRDQYENLTKTARISIPIDIYLWAKRLKLEDRRLKLEDRRLKLEDRTLKLEDAGL